MELQKVGPGMFVGYSYRLYNAADNSLLFATPEEEPDVMVFGVSQDVVPGLVAAIEGLAEGDRFETTLPPQAAFGERFEENLLELAPEIFMRDGKIAEEVKEGADIPMLTQEGFPVRGRVVEITDAHVKMDFNHPFAGLTVRYEGAIEEVRPASPDELKPAGCCGSCGGSGSCSDGSCGGCSDGSCSGSGSCS